jgi:hypothetical protein
MAMDRATGWYLEHQSKHSRRREEEAPGGTPVLAGNKLARLVGRNLSDQQAAKKIGSIVHRTLGMSYGMAAAALARRGVSPLVAGIATGAMAFVVVDEGVMSGCSLPRLWPTRSRATCGGWWGIFGYGAVAGTMLFAVGGLGTIGRKGR